MKNKKEKKLKLNLQEIKYWKRKIKKERQLKKDEKIRFVPTRVKMQNLWPSYDTRMTTFERKMNIIMKLNYQTTQCWRIKKYII